MNQKPLIFRPYLSSRVFLIFAMILGVFYIAFTILAWPAKPLSVITLIMALLSFGCCIIFAHKAPIKVVFTENGITVSSLNRHQCQTLKWEVLHNQYNFEYWNHASFWILSDHSLQPAELRKISHTAYWSLFVKLIPRPNILVIPVSQMQNMSPYREYVNLHLEAADD